MVFGTPKVMKNGVPFSNYSPWKHRPLLCHLDRSVAQWRDLRSSGPFLELFFDRAVSDNCRFVPPACTISKNMRLHRIEDADPRGAEENTMPLSWNVGGKLHEDKGRDQRAGCESPKGGGGTAGHAFLLAVKHGHGDLLPDLDLIRIGDITCSGNVGIMIG